MEQILDDIQSLLNEGSIELSNSEYSELLKELLSDINTRLDCLD